MPNNNYLDGSIYHMVHYSNVAKILLKGGLLSKESLLSADIGYYSIADEEVQDLRDRIYVWSVLEQCYRSIHSYVPFYFAKLTPMLYRRKEMQHEIIFFEVNRTLLKEPNVIFTDGNITNQQLAKFSGETVYIVPATPKTPLCRREYSSRRPQGTNTSCSDVYAHPVFLEKLNWAFINDRWFNDDPDKKRIKHAEVLIPDTVPLSRIAGISAQTREKADKVNTLIKQCGLEGRIPRATARPDLYF